MHQKRQTRQESAFNRNPERCLRLIRTVSHFHLIQLRTYPPSQRHSQIPTTYWCLAKPPYDPNVLSIIQCADMPNAAVDDFTKRDYFRPQNSVAETSLIFFVQYGISFTAHISIYFKCTINTLSHLYSTHPCIAFQNSTRTHSLISTEHTLCAARGEANNSQLRYLEQNKCAVKFLNSFSV